MNDRPRMVNRPAPNEKAIAFVALLGLIVLTATVLAMTKGKPGKEEPSPTASVVASLSTGSQSPVALPADCQIPGPIDAARCLEGLTTAQRDAMTCQHEDGNTDGTPCVWLDPATRALFYVDSSEYQR